MEVSMLSINSHITSERFITSHHQCILIFESSDVIEIVLGSHLLQIVVGAHGSEIVTFLYSLHKCSCCVQAACISCTS